jgi:hypothetical protein
MADNKTGVLVLHYLLVARIYNTYSDYYGVTKLVINHTFRLLGLNLRRNFYGRRSCMRTGIMLQLKQVVLALTELALV